MPREINLRLEALLAERAPYTGRGELARSLGISSALVRAYLEDRWTVLDRTVLERLADFLQCDAGMLLATSESRFFESFRTLSGKEAAAGYPYCLYVCREDANKILGGRAVAFRDHRAMDQVATLLRNNIEQMIDREVSAATSEEFDQHTLQNSVVLGAPMVNAASEIAICRTFGVEPFDASSRALLPFTFRTVDHANPTSAIVEHAADGRRGIWLREEDALIPCDYWPPAEFKERNIKKGRDCAVIIVANHQPKALSEISRKLIVLAGFGGPGTEAAATALVDHFRDLEPRPKEKAVWGVVEVFFRKEMYRMDRVDLRYNWRFRFGGRRPMAFVSRSPRARWEPKTNGS